MLIIYTGNGKGKTSAAVGQGIRAHGQGLRVAFAQFMKQDNIAGEQKVLKEILGENFIAGGLGFFRDEREKEAHRKAALAVVEWAKNKLPQVDMLILDESLYALGSSLLSNEEMQELATLAQKNNTHLVLSGRDLPLWLEKQADIVTEMGEIKHCFPQSHKPIKGIEF